ncbi:acetyl-CoA carboxylase biotin carboxylase subunit [Candidatus Acetothermia bacterium]|nr:acetyl-CoA carboxylase biotin carboxylase subunit [Candidatus Acetothermia bacterium]MBI3642783.1 acetyl-CoA carboxylase biotin carboxylase subunit [Candidatus Acetothermia bacterium]
MARNREKEIKRVLIANRGEIAVRVIRACRELGIESVAVFSDVDRWALHASLADYAYRIGPAPAAESYLQANKIIQIAKEAGCDAVHPGYGFLSQNPEFADSVEKAGLVFIGPEPDSTRLMGNKLAARSMAREQGVPTIPGVYKPVSDWKAANAAATAIGFPVLLKAAAGGGGKGIRLVDNPAELKESFERVVSEVEKSFGDRAVFVEKFIAKAKHIEIQVIGDNQGDVVHLYERECSVQRRYQKLIEESPAPILTNALREEIGKSAVSVAKACHYRSAGTVEFIYDLEEGQYYFLEMNTRIQVEHPVTEMTTGIDLVREQLLIAAGNPLSFTQKQVRPRGAAIECRLYAEDASNNFAPSTGKIEELILPTGPGIRVDSGISPGDVVTLYYDPMLMKLIAWGGDRTQAIERMKNALRELVLVGVSTSIDFHLQALDDPRFVDGSYTTDFIKELKDSELSQEELEDLAVATVLVHEDKHSRIRETIQNSESSQEERWRWQG